MDNRALNQKSRKSIEKQTGLSIEQIISMDIDEIDKVVEKKIGKRLRYAAQIDSRLLGRGSVYIFLNRLFDFDYKKIEKTLRTIQ